jgi:sporulation protein YlmC with PRC-barrel domain
VTPQGALKVFREVRDLQVIDRDGRNCGICDDVEFEKKADGSLELRALLIGPGAIGRRLPRCFLGLFKRPSLKSIVRVPWDDVETVTSRIRLKKPASTYGLLDIDNVLSRYLASVPAL